MGCAEEIKIVMFHLTCLTDYTVCLNRKLYQHGRNGLQGNQGPGDAFLAPSVALTPSEY